MNLRTLEYFVVLSEELNFSNAAARLHIAQPALSQQIRSLERQLGAELVDRGHRPLRLTPAGSYLLGSARQLLGAYEEAAIGTREVGRGIRGWLAIGFTRSSMYSVLPPALKTFHRRYPEVELRLFEMVTEEQVEALRKGTIQIGIGRQPEPIDGFEQRLLLSEPVKLVLPPDHRCAKRKSVKITDVQEDPLILYPRAIASRFSRYIESMYRDEGLVPPVRYRTHEIQTAIGLVAAGLGVCYVGESVAEQGRSDVAYRPIAGRRAKISTLQATWSSTDNSPHVKEFLGCLGEQID